MVANVDREAPITDLIEGHPALVLVCCALLAGPSCGDHSPAQMADTGVCAVEPPPAVLDADALSARLASALEEHSAAVVVQDDVLGEGPDGWDSDPRYPKNSTNCITWVQQVISSAYADTPSSRRRAMDALRYYGSTVSFGTRKHFVDRWIALEPGPLVPLLHAGCAPDEYHHVQLDLDRFAAARGYSCPLFEPSSDTVDFQYLSPRATTRCAASLPPGHYIVFPVASRMYLRIHNESGPMGQVHGAVLTVEGGHATISHASVDRGYVETLPLSDYIASMQGGHEGYTLYTLDPAWTPPALPPMLRIDECWGVCRPPT